VDLFSLKIRLSFNTLFFVLYIGRIRGVRKENRRQQHWRALSDVADALVSECLMVFIYLGDLQSVDTSIIVGKNCRHIWQDRARLYIIPKSISFAMTFTY
jgi:hypothetical protein